MLNNCRVQNPITLFNKELNGAFAGRTNLLPFIHKFETEKAEEDTYVKLHLDK